jgi:hypothetical protein
MAADEVLTRPPDQHYVWELRTAKLVTQEGYRYVSGTGESFLHLLLALTLVWLGSQCSLLLNLWSESADGGGLGWDPGPWTVFRHRRAAGRRRQRSTPGGVLWLRRASPPQPGWQPTTECHSLSALG